MVQWPAVGIGILNYNGKKHLEAFLPSVMAIDYPEYNVYVIDNNSSDGSIEFLKNSFPGINIVSNGANLGFAAGYNSGFRSMAEKYWLMLNSDVELSRGFLKPLVELMEQDDRVGMCQSVLLSYHQKNMFEYGGAAGGFLDWLGYPYCRGRIFETTEENAGQYETEEVFWASGACSLVRKDAYLKVKGMYDYFFMHFEEIDLCWKLHRQGYKVFCHSASEVYHVGGGTLSYQSPRKTFFNFRNNLVMVWRNSSMLYKFLWLPCRIFLDCGASLRYLFRGEAGNFFSVWKGYAAFFYWIFFVRDLNNINAPKSDLHKVHLSPVKSIVWKYYISAIKKFSNL